jgi:hypothetical protein
MDPRVGLDGCGKSRPPLGFDPWTVQPIASRCTDKAIPSHIEIDNTNQWRTQEFFSGGGFQQIQLKTENRENGITISFFFNVLLTVHLSVILIINRLIAQNLVSQKVYYMPLHVSSTMCLSSGGQNCIIQHLVSSHL